MIHVVHGYVDPQGTINFKSILFYLHNCIAIHRLRLSTLHRAITRGDLESYGLYFKCCTNLSQLPWGSCAIDDQHSFWYIHRPHRELLPRT